MTIHDNNIGLHVTQMFKAFRVSERQHKEQYKKMNHQFIKFIYLEISPRIKRINKINKSI